MLDALWDILVGLFGSGRGRWFRVVLAAIVLAMAIVVALAVLDAY